MKSFTEAAWDAGCRATCHANASEAEVPTAASEPGAEPRKVLSKLNAKKTGR